MTVIFKNCLNRISLSHLIDKRIKGYVVDVEVGKILGHVFCAKLSMQDYLFRFPSLAVMNDNTSQVDNVFDFILGLDMLKRHGCKIDLVRNILMIIPNSGYNT